MLIAAPGIHAGIRPGEISTLQGSNAGNASILSISTTQSYFGGSSLHNTGISNAYANVTPITNFVFGTGNWTIEFWYYPSSASQQGILGFRPQGTNGNYISIVANYPASYQFDFYSAASRIASYANAFVANTWVNFALCKNNGNTTMYVNGTKTGNTYVDGTSYSASRLIIGSDDYAAGGTPLNGYIDELRISNTARYTGNFTVSNQPFIDDGNTCLLLHFDQANLSQNIIDDNT